MSSGHDGAAWQVPGFHIELGLVREQAPLSLRAFHHISLPDGSPWCAQYRLEAGYLLRFHDQADFTVSLTGDSITCHGVPDTDEATLQHLLQNQVLPLAMSRKGRLVLHASAVVVEGRALAFLGVSGRGKSTLAAAFAAQGCPFLTDDGLLLEPAHGQEQVMPGRPSLRLREDIRTALGACRQSSATAPNANKLLLLADASLPHAPEACTLAAFYFLGDSVVDGVSIVPLAGREVLLGLMQHCFLLDSDARDLLHKTFTRFGDMVHRIPAFRLEYPRRFEALPELLAMVRQHAAGVLGTD